MRKKRSAPSPIILLAALAGMLAAGGVAVLLRRGGGGLRDRLPAALRRGGPGTESWRCECGQAYRVSGIGRHRVYWPAGAPETEPLLGNACVNCERPLPVH